MVSINSSANSYVLASLRQINDDLATAQTRIGTGKKVNSASDNPAVWSIAQSITSDLNSQDAVSSGIAVAKGKADTAVAALNTISTLLGKIQALSNGAASNPPASVTSVVNQITALQAQITAAASTASFQGENWLTDAAATKNVNISVSSGTPIAASVATAQVTVAGSDLTLALAAPTDQASVVAAAGLATTALTTITAYQATLSTFSAGLSAQSDFLTSLKAVRNTVLGSLVNADLTEESAKVTALQTQQQLAYQALSIGNNSAQSILRLFQ